MAFQAAVKERAGAVLMDVSGPITAPHRKEIAELAVKSRLPVIYGRREPVEAGGLMSYGVSVDDLDRRAATYVDKILKGAKPADLPVEQPREVRVHHQSEGGETDRPDDSAECAGACGPGDQVTTRDARIALNSPSTKSCKVCLRRRSVQPCTLRLPLAGILVIY